MENQELLNPGSDKEKKEKGVENLNPEQEQENPTPQKTGKVDEQETTEQPQEAEPIAEAKNEEPVTPEKKSLHQQEAADKSEKVSEESVTGEGAQDAARESTAEDANKDLPADDAAKDEKSQNHEITLDESVAEQAAEGEPKDAKLQEEEDASSKVETAAQTDAPEEEKSAEDESAPDKEPASREEAPAAAQKTEDNAGHGDIGEEEEDHDHDHDHDDEDGDSLAQRYNSLNKEELVEALEALVTSDDINYIRKHIGFIKVAYRNHLKDHNVVEYEKSMSRHDDTDSDEAGETAHKDELKERFENAFDVYKSKKSLYDQALEKQKQNNLQAKEAILEDLRNLIESEEELKKTYDVFKELQEKWREIGPVPQGAKNTLWNNYHFLVEKFFDKVKINKELRDLDLKKNLEAKAELCEKAEELLLESSINKSFQKLQKLHEAWKETGPVPKDKKDEIWDRFKAASDALNESRQSYYDALREEQNKNYAAKILLCEQAEQLSEFTSDSPRKWQEATDKVNELFKVWKTIGFAPKKVNDEVWVRFRTALDGFFKTKKDFFLKYKEEQTENYNQKLNLCMQAEALKDSEDWKHTTDELIALQKQWKKIGPVPKKFSDKVWKRFRAACDEFFNRKSEYFSNIGEKQEENLRKKQELIQKVKSFKYSSDNNENLNTLKDFQRQWMEIGHVPIKEKDKVQNEFRKTINEQFDKLNISRKAKSAMGFKSKIESLKNSPNADNIIYKEKNVLINKINSLQNDIKLWENNIGFFASSKKADVLKSEFENKIEKAKNDIVLLEEKLRILNESR